MMELQTLTREERGSIAASIPYTQVQGFLRWVYVWMFIGLAVTAGAALFTLNSPALMEIRTNPIVVFGAFFVQLGLVFGIGWGMSRISPGVAALLFMVYAALNGFVFSLLLAFFSIGEVFGAFATTSILFGIMTIIGFTTTYDLTKLGGFLGMAVIGLLVAIIVNIFLGSSILNFIISLVGVVIFTGLTAYDTQNLKLMGAQPEIQNDGALAAKMSIFGALGLYINFINIFIFLLQLTGGGGSND